VSGRHWAAGDPVRTRAGRPRAATLLFATALLVGLAVIGALLAGVARNSGHPAAAPATSAAAASVTSAAAASVTSAATARPTLIDRPDATAPAPASTSTTAAPSRLVIARIGVDTPLQSLGLDASGALDSPSEWAVAGWYAGGVRPGDRGPAVIAGHVDSRNGPAVFYRLRQLHAGDQLSIVKADGATVTFVVDDARSYPKNAFPTAAVYGPTPDAELRLITCTGDFDWQARSYLDNLVVSAHLVS
jgi:hypothetical protein